MHPEFLSGLLDYIVADDPVLIWIAGASGTSVEQIVAAHAALSPSVDWS
jgi:hypothetical protein